MFQSRITCKEYKEYLRLLETDEAAALNFKVKYDSTDQWFLEQAHEAHINHNHNWPKTPFNSLECQLQEGNIENLI